MLWRRRSSIHIRARVVGPIPISAASDKDALVGPRGAEMA